MPYKSVYKIFYNEINDLEAILEAWKLENRSKLSTYSII